MSPDEWLDVTIPPGIEEGQVLRLKGKGGPGFGGGPPGDALIEVHIAPHPWFRREGDDIHMELPVSLAEAVLGARVPVATVTGPVTMTIPKGSDTGTRLRLRGKGIQRKRQGKDTAGDQYVTLKVVIGASGDPDLAQFLEGWADDAPDRPAPRDGRRRAGRGTRGDAIVIGLDELVRRFAGLERTELTRWIENRWVLPEPHTAQGAGEARDLAVPRGRRRPGRADPRNPPRIRGRRRGDGAGAGPARPGLQPAPPDAPAVRRGRSAAGRHPRSDPPRPAAHQAR